MLTTAAREPERQSYPVAWIAALASAGARHAAAVARIASLARRADVVYSTGMLGRSSLGAELARTPLVMKLTADPAYERARRLGLSGGSLEEFQKTPGRRDASLRAARDRSLRHAAHIVTPSRFLEELMLGWGVPAERASLLPNPTPPLPQLPAREELRRRYGIERPTVAFAGRLTAQKALPRYRGGARGGGRAADRRRGPGTSRARAARPCALPRPPAAHGGARAVRGRRRSAPLLGVGELPSRARRGARGRHAGHRHPGRRSVRGGARRGERPPGRAGRRRCARRGDRAFLRGGRRARAGAAGGRGIVGCAATPPNASTGGWRRSCSLRASATWPACRPRVPGGPSTSRTATAGRRVLPGRIAAPRP